MNVTEGVFYGTGKIQEPYTTSPLSYNLREDDTQAEIRINLEIGVKQKILDLYQSLVILNTIHDDCLLGDRRKKKNIKLEKQLSRYMKER